MTIVIFRQHVATIRLSCVLTAPAGRRCVFRTLRIDIACTIPYLRRRLYTEKATEKPAGREQHDPARQLVHST
jgi:hypothetical protein